MEFPMSKTFIISGVSSGLERRVRPAPGSGQATGLVLQVADEAAVAGVVDDVQSRAGPIQGAAVDRIEPREIPGRRTRTIFGTPRAHRYARRDPQESSCVWTTRRRDRPQQAASPAPAVW